MPKMEAEHRVLRRSNVHKAQLAGRVLRNSQQLLQEQCSSLTEMLRRAKRERSGRSGSNDQGALLGNRAEVVQEVLEEAHAVDLSDLLLNAREWNLLSRASN
jgi:urocanate hydratase